MLETYIGYGTPRLQTLTVLCGLHNIEQLKEDIPQYHMRAMKRVMYEKFGPVTPSTKKSFLRHLYKDLVGDFSASVNLSESKIDERVAALFELEELSLVYDLCDHFSGRQSKFDVFWQRANKT